MKSKTVCNHDCLHCIFTDDCHANARDKSTTWERAVIKGAFGGWEQEMFDGRVLEMLSRGNSQHIIAKLLKVPLQSVQRSVRRLRKAGKLRLRRVTA